MIYADLKNELRHGRSIELVCPTKADLEAADELLADLKQHPHIKITVGPRSAVATMVPSFETSIQQMYSQASVAELKAILTAMSPEAQQEIYEFLHGPLKCRIR